ncbi:MAG: CHASE domain-containing protein [Armatimonadetes bacterium]|nr:CHASE domain-containing protein [Armatimonadota bacterium]
MKAQQELQAERDCYDALQQFRVSVNIMETVLSDLAIILESSSLRKADQSRLAQQLTDGRRGLDGLGIVEHVSLSERSSFERLDLGGKPIFSLESGVLRPSIDKPDYYVVRSVEPMARNRKAIGLDLLSEPRRRDAVERACNTGEVTLSEPIIPVQDDNKAAPSIMMVKAVGWVRNEKPKLLVNSIFRVSLIAQKVNAAMDRAAIVEILDTTDSLSHRIFSAAEMPNGNLHTNTLEIGGRKLLLRIEPARDPVLFSKVKALERTVWLLGTIASLLASFIVGVLGFKRIEADVHRKELQQMAAELLDEGSKTSLR